MLIESVPNVSEGRRPAVVADFADAVSGVADARLLDVSSDASHNRSVLTIAGEPAALQQAVLALADRAISQIDLRTHTGGHPRIGAIDVIPFVPLAGATMADCVALAKSVSAQIAGRFGVPVYLYEEAASDPARWRLEDIRRGEFEGLAEKMARPGWAADFGPRAPHPSAGATVVGARGPLIAYNINLATDRLDVAKAIAGAVRFSSGGLPHVKAMGVALPERGIAQVSMNLTDFRVTSLRQVFERVGQEAARYGVSILESEIVGLVPEAALTGTSIASLKLATTSDCILEHRLAQR